MSAKSPSVKRPSIGTTTHAAAGFGLSAAQHAADPRPSDKKRPSRDLGLSPRHGDGPSFQIGQHCVWFRNNARHREDGPAEVWPGGALYYLKGVRYEWALPNGLWAIPELRKALMVRFKGTAGAEIAEAQRAKALTILGNPASSLAPEVRQMALIEALASPDPGLRRWGARLAAHLSSQSVAGTTNG